MGHRRRSIRTKDIDDVLGGLQSSVLAGELRILLSAGHVRDLCGVAAGGLDPQ